MHNKSVKKSQKKGQFISCINLSDLPTILTKPPSLFVNIAQLIFHVLSKVARIININKE